MQIVPLRYQFITGLADIISVENLTLEVGEHIHIIEQALRQTHLDFNVTFEGWTNCRWLRVGYEKA